MAGKHQWGVGPAPFPYNSDLLNRMIIPTLGEVPSSALQQRYYGAGSPYGAAYPSAYYGMTEHLARGGRNGPPGYWHEEDSVPGSPWSSWHDTEVASWAGAPPGQFHFHGQGAAQRNASAAQKDANARLYGSPAPDTRTASHSSRGPDPSTLPEPESLEMRITKSAAKAGKKPAASHTGGDFHPQQQAVGPVMPSGHRPFRVDQLVGMWADSLGNSVSVEQTDAYQMKLVATLSKPPRKDVHLTVKPTTDFGWSCGNAELDSTWSTYEQLHWYTADGRVSVWIRLPSEEY